jgi:restriction endonuclease Mrr
VIDDGVGVANSQTHELKRIDKDYFSPDAYEAPE